MAPVYRVDINGNPLTVSWGWGASQSRHKVKLNIGNVSKH